jgi:hypothetical protein
VRSICTQFVFPTVRGAISEAAQALLGFRWVELSVQGHHLHFLVEAASKQCLSSGIMARRSASRAVSTSCWFGVGASGLIGVMVAARGATAHCSLGARGLLRAAGREASRYLVSTA